MKKLSIIVEVARKKADMTYRRVGVQCDIPWSTVRRIEKGIIINPTFKTVMKLCKVLGIDPWSVEI